MAEMVISNAYVLFNSVDLSDHVREIRLSTSVDLPDSTAMGDAWHEHLPSLKDFSLTVVGNQDFASGKWDATMFAALGTSVPIEIRPVNTTVGAGNPKFTGNVLISSYDPIGGGVGDVLTSSVQMQGNGALTRATS